MTIHSDNSATVHQEYFEAPSTSEFKRDSLGQWHIETTLASDNYKSTVISSFQDTNVISFSFDISTIDSLPNYVSGLPKNFFQMKIIEDSLFIFSTQVLKSNPSNFHSNGYTFVIDFPKAIKNVSSTDKNSIYWKPKKDNQQIWISVNLKKIYKEKKTLLVEVELKQNAR